jgi:signal transduction histidine kinase
MNQRRIAWTVWAASIALAITSVLVDAAARTPQRDVGEYLFSVATIVLYATVGMLITSRQRGNRVGWLFAWVGFSASGSLLFGAYASLALERDLPLLALTAWAARVGFAAIFGPLAFLFLIFPTGKPLSRSWEWVMRVMLAAYAVNIVGFALTPGPLDAGFAELHGRVTNPFGLPIDWKEAIETVTTVAGAIVALGAVASVASLIQRYRRAAQLERQQIRWLAFLGVFLGVVLLLSFGLIAAGVVNDEGIVSGIAFFAFIFGVFLGIPAVCGIAILKHGLWDLDVVVKKTVQYGVLVVGFTVVVLLLFVAAPAVVVGIGTDAGGVIPFTLGAVITVGFTLARSRARRWANRIVYGKRSTPYEVLSDFAERVGGTYSTEDVLPRMAQLLGEATGARAARVWLRVGEVMRPDAVWPADAPVASVVPAPIDELPGFGGDHAFEVRHQGELLGALTVKEAPDDPMNPAKEKLARDMAAQAGLVLRNVRLLEDLRESRRRIVSAQDARARKLERDIHDGAQQQLVALQVKQRLADSMIERDPPRAHELMQDLQRDTASALDELRDLARGIYPPLLADEGLAAALGSQARKSPIPVEIRPDGIGRYPQEVEAAVYFSCLEALQNVTKYAQASHALVRLSQDDGVLRFEVSDDGRGFDPGAAPRGSGLQGIVDRLEAIGGRLDIRTAPGAGTSLTGSIPLAQGTRA